jgi:hypothetical protein
MAVETHRRRILGTLDAMKELCRDNVPFDLWEACLQRIIAATFSLEAAARKSEAAKIRYKAKKTVSNS